MPSNVSVRVGGFNRLAASPTVVKMMSHPRIDGDSRRTRLDLFTQRTAVGSDTHERSCSTACHRRNPI